MRMVTAFVAILLAASPAARAEDAATPEAVALAKSFAKICLLELPNFESVILRAKIEGWRQVAGPKREPILHKDSKPTMPSWMTKGVDGLPVKVIMVRTVEHGQTWSCAVQNPDISPKGLTPALAHLLTLPDATPQIVDHKGRPEALTKWRIRYGVQLVNIVLATNADEKAGVALSATQFRGDPD